jgi:hypothetical protein
VRAVILQLPGQDRLQLLMLGLIAHGITMSPLNFVGKPSTRWAGRRGRAANARDEGEGSAPPPSARPRALNSQTTEG